MATRKKNYLTKAKLMKKLAGVKAIILDVDGVTNPHGLARCAAPLGADSAARPHVTGSRTARRERTP